ncbi:hypothetical protein RND71_037912 [Anisodus tanguticus]|uniref:CLAVATA3/ESR (CLE)-related protein n=1 Tax=Anisodus tanguticus TaxID=243964 RepID=A0AAE1QZ23_9SOLA|nr:hypothetical protein RND71_037912 [Anisodus tanguticus]
MASFRFWFCFFVILLSCLGSESRPLEAFTEKRREMVMKIAREIIRERLHKARPIKYDVNRVSPGGPDPKHH